MGGWDHGGMIARIITRLMTRPLLALALLISAWPSSADAQAITPAPFVLGAPVSAKAVALGSAWVTGRDQDVVFSNPAQIIGARSDFGLTLGRSGPGEDVRSFATIYTAGKWSFTLGAGLQFVDNAGSQTSLGVVDAAFVYKNFRIGGAVKYAASSGTTNAHTALFDLGVARNVFGGVAGLAIQNLGTSDRSIQPSTQLKRQVALGWSTTKPAGPLDLQIFTQVGARSGRGLMPAGGIEAGYSWIEGYAVALRAGLRRPDDTTEFPLTLGAAFSGDRLTIDYALRFFDDNRHAQLVTIRWR